MFVNARCTTQMIGFPPVLFPGQQHPLCTSTDCAGHGIFTISVVLAACIRASCYETPITLTLIGTIMDE